MKGGGQRPRATPNHRICIATGNGDKAAGHWNEEPRDTRGTGGYTTGPFRSCSLWPAPAPTPPFSPPVPLVSLGSPVPREPSNPPGVSSSPSTPPCVPRPPGSWRLLDPPWCVLLSPWPWCLLDPRVSPGPPGASWVLISVW